MLQELLHFCRGKFSPGGEPDRLEREGRGDRSHLQGGGGEQGGGQAGGGSQDVAGGQGLALVQVFLVGGTCHWLVDGSWEVPGGT